MANERRLIDANAPWIKRHFTKRLVDVFALIETIEDITWYHVNETGLLTEGANSNRDIPLFKVNDIFSALGSASTVDAVEVVHGRMEEVEIVPNYMWKYRCSCCHSDGERWYNYCPHCGAMMDGGKENG